MIVLFAALICSLLMWIIAPEKASKYVLYASFVCFVYLLLISGKV